MPNTLLTLDMITREAVRLWKNSNAFLMNVDHQYDDQFARPGSKIGNNLRIRLPNDYTVVKGPGLQVQDTAETSIALVLGTQAHVDMAFSTADRTMTLDDYSTRVLAPAVNNLAGQVALDLMAASEGGICNFVANQDAANVILNPVAGTYLDAKATLAINSAPEGNRKIVNSPRTAARVVASLAGLLNPSSRISNQYVTGEMYDALGFLWMEDQTTIIHTNGAAAQAGSTVNGANQTGTSITVNALAAGFNIGDIITFAGVNAVNRVTKETTGELRQFVVTATVGAGATSIPIYPAIIPPVGGQKVQYQTVTASPANAAQVNPVSGLAASATYRKNFAYCPEAVTIAMADLEIPGGVAEAARDSFDGVSMRMVTDYFIGSDQLITRLDVLYGFLWIRPEWACIVADAI